VTERRTSDDLRATPEGRLLYPGAVALEQRGADEGEGTGFDQLDPSAVAETQLRAAGTWSDVVTWYGQQLDALGWRLVSQMDAPVAAQVYRRAPEEEFWIRRTDRDAGMDAPKGAFNEPGTAFSTILKVRPSRRGPVGSRPRE
jgi:hypothetical protein